MQKYRRILGVIAALVAAVVVFSLSRGEVALPRIPGGDRVISVAGRHPAPEFAGVDGWVNSSPLTVRGLRGHVVLVDFWTFSCVNCVRTIPHTKALYDRYRNDGLVIVGVHSPEFDFEKVSANVRSAVRRLGVTWPVAIDSEMATWQAFSNTSWPAGYLIDRDGNIAYTHVGEGDYAAIDSAVSSVVAGPSGAALAATNPASGSTPELYAGSSRGTLDNNERYGPPGAATTYPNGDPGDPDTILVTGSWADQGEYLEARSGGHIKLRFHATDVYVVAGTDGGPVSAVVTLDGAAVAAPTRGADLGADGHLAVTRSDIFHVVANDAPGDHLIDIAVPTGFRLYTFTFG